MGKYTVVLFSMCTAIDALSSSDGEATWIKIIPRWTGRLEIARNHHRNKRVYGATTVLKKKGTAKNTS